MSQCCHLRRLCAGACSDPVGNLTRGPARRSPTLPPTLVAVCLFAAPIFVSLCRVLVACCPVEGAARTHPPMDIRLPRFASDGGKGEGQRKNAAHGLTCLPCACCATGGILASRWASGDAGGEPEGWSSRSERRACESRCVCVCARACVRE